MSRPKSPNGAAGLPLPPYRPKAPATPQQALAKPIRQPAPFTAENFPWAHAAKDLDERERERFTGYVFRNWRRLDPLYAPAIAERSRLGA